MAFTSTSDTGAFKHWRLLVPFVPLFLAGMAEAGGRPDDAYSGWFGHVAGGVALAQGDFGDVADDGSRR